MHILNNRCIYGITHNTMEILKTCKTVHRMNYWEALNIQTFQQQGLWIQEQHTPGLNPLYMLVPGVNRYNADDIHKTGQQTQLNHLSTSHNKGNYQIRLSNIVII